MVKLEPECWFPERISWSHLSPANVQLQKQRERMETATYCLHTEVASEQPYAGAGLLTRTNQGFSMFNRDLISLSLCITWHFTHMLNSCSQTPSLSKLSCATAQWNPICNLEYDGDVNEDKVVILTLKHQAELQLLSFTDSTGTLMKQRGSNAWHVHYRYIYSHCKLVWSVFSPCPVYSYNSIMKVVFGGLAEKHRLRSCSYMREAECEKLDWAAAAVALSLISSVVRCSLLPFRNSPGHRKPTATNHRRGPRARSANRSRHLSINA